MKKLNLLGLLGALAITLVACSEGSYTPTTSIPYSQTQTGMYTNPYTNPYYNPAVNGYQYQGQRNPGIQFYNPYLAFNNQFYSSCSAQAQLQMQLRAQPMFYCQARLQMPNFYAYTSMNNNCWARRQPTYTPSSCACATGNCDCPRILAQMRNQCRYTRFTTTSTTTTATSSPSNNSTPTTTDNDNTAPDNTSIKELWLSLANEDAKALYDRLAKEVKVIKTRSNQDYTCVMENDGRNDSDYACDKNAKSTNNNIQPSTGAEARARYQSIKKRFETTASIKTGTNYKCMSNENSAKDYVCDYDVSTTDGALNIQTPISPLAVSQFPAEAVSSPFLSIAALDQNPKHEGTILIKGPTAENAYNKLSVKEAQGAFPGSNKTALIKTGKQIECYRTASPSYTECRIKVKLDTGDALNAI